MSRDCLQDSSEFKWEGYSDQESLNGANVMGDRNRNNIFATNSKLLQSSKFSWPEITMGHIDCVGHQCLDPVNLDENVINQRLKRQLKKKFTPPVFPKTGIAVCPEPPPPEEHEKEDDKPSLKAVDRADHVSVLEDDVKFKTPGNMEFIEYTYPIIKHVWRYTTYAVPYNRSDWRWIYNFIKRIKNSFPRKYHCELMLCTEPGKYKGRVAYLVKLEAETQGNILRCRSGLPKCLKDILVIPSNAYRDVECYISEYLIKRKYIFKLSRNIEAHDKLVNKDIKISKIRSSSAADSSSVKSPSALAVRTSSFT